MYKHTVLRGHKMSSMCNDSGKVHTNWDGHVMFASTCAPTGHLDGKHDRLTFGQVAEGQVVCGEEN